MNNIYLKTRYEVVPCKIITLQKSFWAVIEFIQTEKSEKVVVMFTHNEEEPCKQYLAGFLED
jgi:hypothetical protein